MSSDTHQKTRLDRGHETLEPTTLYKNFFGLQDVPFNVSPNPHCFFHTRETQKALACMTYGIRERRGCILLTGEVGTGKTTLLNKLLHELRGGPVATAFVFNTTVNTTEFLDYVMTDFGIECKSTLKSQMLWCLSQWLLERYRASQTAVLVVDEAQNLSTQMLEEIRMLTNLETYNQKLLQIILSGQPELEKKLKQSQLRQLRQRITLHSRTHPLTQEQTHGYIVERLRLAGADGRPIFTQEAMNAIYRYSQGIQRVINRLCEHALLYAYADRQKLVVRETIERAARQFELDMLDPPTEWLSRGHSVDHGAGNASPDSPQGIDAIAEARPSLAERPTTRNADCLKTDRPVEEAGEKKNGDGNLVAASVPSCPGGIKEPPLTIPDQPSASPLEASSPRVEQPVPAPVGQHLAQAVSLQLIPPSRPRRGFPLAVALVTLAIVGAAEGVPYFLSHRHVGSVANRNLALGLAAVEGNAKTGSTGPVSPHPTALPEVPSTLESRSTSTTTEGKSGADALSGNEQVTKVKAAALSDLAIVTPLSTQPSPAQAGRIVVSANVKGARISVDGRSDPSWVTPYTFSAVSSGIHGVVFAKDGYEDAYLRLRVKPASTNFVKAQLRSSVGLINIVTNPPGLEVHIDGRPSGVSPVDTTVPVGEHIYTIKRPGFEDYHSRITIKSGSIITRRVDFGGTSAVPTIWSPFGEPWSRQRYK